MRLYDAVGPTVILEDGAVVEVPHSYSSRSTGEWQKRWQRDAPKEITYLHEWEGISFEQIAELFNKLGIKDMAQSYTAENVERAYLEQCVERDSAVIELLPDPDPEHEVDKARAAALTPLWRESEHLRREINLVEAEEFNWTQEELDEATRLSEIILSHEEYQLGSSQSFRAAIYRGERELAAA